MSRFSNLTLVLSLAACEHAAPTQNPPMFPEAQTAPAPAPTPAPTPEPAKIVEAAPTPPEPAPPPAQMVAPVKPKIVKKPVAPPAAIKSGEPPEKIWVGKPGCRPGSRMACRWREEDDERTQPRVIKKAGETTEQP